MKTLLAIFILTLSVLSSKVLAQSDGVLYTNTDNERIVRNKIFEEALIRSYYENPMTYEFHRKGLINSSEAQDQLQRLTNDRAMYRFYRVAPIPAVSEHGMLEWEERRDKANLDLRKYMSEHPEEVSDVARQMRIEVDKSARLRRPSTIGSLYAATQKLEVSNKLPNSVGIAGLRQQFPEIADRLEKDGLSEDQIVNFCEGNMTPEQFRAALHITEEQYNVYIQNNFLVTPPPEQILNGRDLTQLQKQAELEKFNQRYEVMIADFESGISILRLLDKKAAYEVSQIGMGSLKVFEGVSKMSIAGRLDIKNLASIAGGVSMLVDLFGGDAQTAAFNKIMESQKQILEKLEEMDGKLDKLQMDVDFLIQITQYNQRQMSQSILGITKRLSDIKVQENELKELNFQMSQEADIRHIQADKEAFVNDFMNFRGSLSWQKKMDALSHPNYMDDPTENYFTQLNILLSKIAVVATIQLENADYNAFIDTDKISELKIHQIQAKSDVNRRLGMLPSMGEWLQGHLSGDSSKVIYPENAARLNGRGLKLRFPNPAAFSQLLKEYIDLASFRPIRYQPSGEVAPDNNIKDFCNDVYQIEQGIEQMRLHVPLAVAVFNYHLRNIKDVHEEFVLEKSQQLRIYDDSSKEFPKVYFNGWSEEEIVDSLNRMSENEFQKLGIAVGVFLVEERLYPSAWQAPEKRGGSERNNNSWSYIPEIHVFRTFYTCIDNQFKAQYGALEYPFKQTKTVQTMAGKNAEWRFANPTVEILEGRRLSAMVLVLAHEIYSRQRKIEQDWQQKVWADENQTEYYLGSLYKAHFILQTLVIGGYGHDYSLTPGLEPIAEIMLEADQIIRKIEVEWKNGMEIFGIYSMDENNLEHYYTSHTSYREIPKGFQSIVVAYSIPEAVFNSHINDIGNLQSARDALRWASQFEDMKTGNCQSYPKP